MIGEFATVRQSLLASFDDCALSTLFSLRHEQGWSTHPQAFGTIFHRVCAACLREMVARDSETIPPDVALDILEEVLRQRDVPPEEIVRVPLRDLGALERVVRKWASDNAFSVRNLIATEERLFAPITYRLDDGSVVERTITGQLDALISRPPDEAIVVDWKTSWALPPRREEDDRDPGVSYHGYFQQMTYAYLVLMNYPSIKAVVLREFYARRSQARPARVTRQDLPDVTRRLSILVEAFDRAVAAGEPPSLRLEVLEAHGHWKPSPGRHCFWCAKAADCPLDDDYKDGGIRSPEDAERAAAARQIARSVDKRLTAWLKAWVDLHGPVPVRRAKGRLVLGYRKVKGGLRFEEFTPSEADRPTTEVAFNPNLEAALREAADHARAAGRTAERDRGS